MMGLNSEAMRKGMKDSFVGALAKTVKTSAKDGGGASGGLESDGGADG